MVKLYLILVLSVVKGKVILSPKDLLVLSNGRGDILQ